MIPQSAKGPRAASGPSRASTPGPDARHIASAAAGVLDVLLVEDDPGDARLTMDALHLVGEPPLRIQCALGEDEALAALSNESYDVVFLGVPSPAGRGRHAVEVLARAAPDTPVIALTSSDDEARALAPLRADGHDVVSRDEITTRLLSRVIAYAVGRRQVDEALRASEARWRFALRGAGEGAWDWNVRSGMILRSSRARDLLGFSENDGDDEGRDWDANIHPDDLERVHADVSRYLAGTAASYTSDYRIVGRDGSVRWVHTRGLTVSRDADGRPLRVIGTHADITEAKSLMTELQQSHDLLAALAAQVPGALYQFQQFPDGRTRIPFANETLRDIFELSPEEVRDDASAVFARVHPDDSPAVIASIRESARHLHPWDMEFRVELPRQGVRWRQALAQPQRLGDGSTLWHGFVTDITDRKRAELELEGRESRYRAVAESASDAIVTVDAEGRIREWNAAAQRMYGYAREDVLDRPIATIIPDGLVLQERHDGDGGEPAGAAETGNGTTVISGVRRGGAAFPIELSLSAYHVAESQFFTAIMRDITARVTTEKDRVAHEVKLREAQRMEAIGTLAGGIAHDFNNLLTAIIGHSELAVLGLSPADPARDDIEQVRLAAERAAALTKQLLTFARRRTIETRPTCLDRLVFDLHKLLRRLLGENIEIVTTAEEGLWPVRADAGQIEQAVVNLAVNARDAMAGGGRLGLSLRNLRVDDHEGSDIPPGDYVELGASDTGCGMSEELQRRIFEPFFTTKEKGRGTGLGLATVYGIVQQHEGHIRVASRPGGGTTFRLVFPRTADAVADSEARTAVAAPPRGSQSILLVEDDLLVRNITHQILGQLGYTVVVAETPHDAIAMAADVTREVDLLLTDIVMPLMSGSEVAAQVRALRPWLPVVLMSGYTDESIADLRSGVRDCLFLQKPFSSAQLAERVSEALKTREAPRTH